MRVQLGTLTVNDEIRRVIRRWKGQSGLATRAEVKTAWNELAQREFEILLEEYR